MYFALAHGVVFFGEIGKLNVLKFHLKKQGFKKAYYRKFNFFVIFLME